MRNAIVFNADRDGYSIDQIRRPMTVGDLMSILQDCNEDDLVILSHDNDYTFGSLSCVRYFEENEDEEWEEI